MQYSKHSGTEKRKVLNIYSRTAAIIISSTLSVFAVLPAAAAGTKYYCGASFDPTPETRRYVFFDGVGDASSRYQQQFISAVMAKYGLSNSPNAWCAVDETDSQISSARANRMANASQYVNASGAVQVFRFHWVPSAAIRIPD
jgi:hypothetical protein